VRCHREERGAEADGPLFECGWPMAHMMFRRAITRLAPFHDCFVPAVTWEIMLANSVSVGQYGRRWLPGHNRWRLSP